MSDQVSHATQPSESDFHDSHPLSDAINSQSISSVPSIGDLNNIETDSDSKTFKTQAIGDITQIDTMDKSEILSDIAILDEAYAELEKSDIQISSAIPILSEAITAPTESRIITDDKTSNSIPLLNQEATVFANLKSIESEPSTPTIPFSASTESEMQNDASEPATDTPLFETSSSDIIEIENTIETAAQVTSDIVLPEANKTTHLEENTESLSNVTAIDQNISMITDVEPLANQDDDALEALLTDEVDVPEYDDPNITSNISNLSLEIESVLEANTISIDEKIANASSGNLEESDLTELSFNLDDNLVDNDDLNKHHSEAETSSEISKFNPAVDLDDDPITHTSHSVGILGKNNDQGNQLNLSIPFELHSQLSKKIDELVIDATSSITDELQCQLTSRLDILLSNAVESVLPKLVNQMAIELQQDVNKSIQRNLPNIINDVLNKTRLHH